MYTIPDIPCSEYDCTSPATHTIEDPDTTLPKAVCKEHADFGRIYPTAAPLRGRTPRMLCLLGRSIAGVVADARTKFGLEPVVIAQDGDQLQAPDGLEAIPASTFVAERHYHYVLVANGGRTSQLVLVLKAMLDNDASFDLWDLQPEGAALLWQHLPEY